MSEPRYNGRDAAHRARRGHLLKILSGAVPAHEAKPEDHTAAQELAKTLKLTRLVIAKPA
jgi:hypothetical protein